METEQLKAMYSHLSNELSFFAKRVELSEKALGLAKELNKDNEELNSLSERLFMDIKNMQIVYDKLDSTITLLAKEYQKASEEVSSLNEKAEAIGANTTTLTEQEVTLKPNKD